MISNLWPGGTPQGLFKFLPVHRFLPSIYSERALQTEYSKHDRLLRILKSDGPILRIALRVDGKRIISGNSDSTLRLWDPESGKSVGQPLIGHEDDIMSVAISPNGKRIVSGSKDKTLRLWDVFEGWADSLCKKLNRNMTQQEWIEWISPDIPYQKVCLDYPIPDEPSQPSKQAVAQ